MLAMERYILLLNGYTLYLEGYKTLYKSFPWRGYTLLLLGVYTFTSWVYKV